VRGGRPHGELRDRLLPGGPQLPAQARQLEVPDLERPQRLLARCDLLEEAVSLFEHPRVAAEGPGVAGPDLDQELVEQASAVLRPRLHQVQVVGPEEGDPKQPGQVHTPAGLAVDLDPATSPLSLHEDRDAHLHASLAALDHGGDPRLRAQRADQVRFPARAGRRGEREHRHRFQEVRLALPVGAQEEVQAGPRFEIEAAIVAVVAEFEPDQAQAVGKRATWRRERA
jgi:hypothetical protein